MATTPEGRIQQAVCQLLDIYEAQGKLTYWRQNNTGIWDSKLGRFRKPSGAGYKAGVPDVVCCIKGDLVAFEIKSATGTQTKDQKNVQAQIERCGGQYFIIRDPSEAEKIIRALIV